VRVLLEDEERRLAARRLATSATALEDDLFELRGRWRSADPGHLAPRQLAFEVCDAMHAIPSARAIEKFIAAMTKPRSELADMFPGQNCRTERELVRCALGLFAESSASKLEQVASTAKGGAEGSGALRTDEDVAAFAADRDPPVELALLIGIRAVSPPAVAAATEPVVRAIATGATRAAEWMFRDEQRAAQVLTDVRGAVENLVDNALPPIVRRMLQVAVPNALGELFRDMSRAIASVPREPIALMDSWRADLVRATKLTVEEALDAPGPLQKLAAERAREPRAGAIESAAKRRPRR
jgi:hypothetical protein